MTCKDEVVKIGRKMDKMISTQTLDDAVGLDLLNALRKLPMNLDVLQKTRIGMTVNNFRKSSNNEQVVSLAKALIKSWKKLLPESGSQSGRRSSQTSSTPPVSRSCSTLSNSGKGDDDSRDSQPNDVNDGQQSDSSRGSESPRLATAASGSSDAVNNSSGTGGMTAPMTNDSVRLKCRELLAAALRTPPEVEGGADPDTVAAIVEDCIFKEFKNTEQKYKTRIRSRISNLKDAKNPRLREYVLVGNISPEQLAVMTAEEMANEEMKKLRAKLTKEAIDDHQMATQGGTKSDLFKCGRCGKRDTTYNQVQTRSADEPMTTFVLCNACGNRWKFC